MIAVTDIAPGRRLRSRRSTSVAPSLEAVRWHSTTATRASPPAGVASWIQHRFVEACDGLGTDGAARDDRLVITW